MLISSSLLFVRMVALFCFDLVDSLGILTWKCHLQTKFCFFLHNLKSFISFSCPIELGRTSSTVLIGVVRLDILALFPILRGKHSVSHHSI